MTSSAASRHWASCISAAAEELSNAAEVSSVMEGMLDDLEILQHVNESKRLQRELVECRRTIQRLQEAEAKMLAEQAAATAKLDAERATAGALKDSFAKELWSLTKELRAKEQQKQQLDELQVRVAVVPQLQAELQQARAALREMEAIAVANAVSLSVSNGTAAVEEAASAADAAAASLQSDLMTPPAEAAAAVAAVPLSQSPLLALPDKLLLAVYSYLEMPAVTSAAATCSAAYCKVCAAHK
jgi:chromosome segregation ATPase